MRVLQQLTPARVFAHFEDISAIPRGSGNRKGIADHIEAFAAAQRLRCVHDAAHNVIVYKNGSAGREQEPPVILQGHLDMVCQKAADSPINFATDGLRLYIDGDELRACGTTLGADNGIAVAMLLAVLESTTLSHPPIEAVFTADEEIGMLGAWELDMELLSGRRMLNLDAEEDDTLTVSCAGGSDLVLKARVSRESREGTPVTVCVSGLRGGHSGVEIDKNRTNADKLMGRLLLHTAALARLININGGDKANAIPGACTATVLADDAPAFVAAATAFLDAARAVIAESEPDFAYTMTIGEADMHTPMIAADAARVTALLAAVPDGVVRRSPDIEGLVETSLNLGILQTADDTVTMHHALRSNKQTALELLECMVKNAASPLADEIETFGHYPPWEWKADSPLQQTFVACYTAQRGAPPSVAAIHAGLECAVFTSRLSGLDCIAFGPTMRGVHTTAEALSISSTQATYELLTDILEKM